MNGEIEKKFKLSRSSNHAVSPPDVAYSSYSTEREIFLGRHNFSTENHDFTKTKAGVEPYFVAYDCDSFPTIMKNRVDKRRAIDFIYSNEPGRLICLANKRDKFVSLRD